MRSAGLADLADRLTAALPVDAGRPSNRLLLLLGALEGEMRLQDPRTARLVVDRIAHGATSGHQPDPPGLWVDLAPVHQELFGAERVNLGDGPDMEPLLSDLRQLYEELR